jgi:Disulphide bond corrector protein DsbC
VKAAAIGSVAGFLFVLAAASAALFDTVPQTPSWVTPLPVSKITVAAGRPGKVQLRFKIADGYHINSHEPGSELLIPTTLQLNPPTDVGVGSITYPKGHDLTLAIAPDEKLNVYTGEFAISAKVSAMRTATPGDYKVHGQLKYQACNDRSCFPPKLAPVEFEVKVLKSRIRSGSTAPNPPQSPHVHN